MVGVVVAKILVTIPELTRVVPLKQNGLVTGEMTVVGDITKIVV